MIDIFSDLKNNSYLGRGILIGKSEDGKSAVIAYFIMGRSSNSRNRIFVEDVNGIKTEAFDSSKVVNPSLIIYSPVRVLDNSTIVTNGDQTDTVYDYIVTGKSFEDALRTRFFEPDEPNFTPRISGIVNLKDSNFSYKLNILKSDEGNKNACIRYFFEYETPVSGCGHFIHTYKTDGNPIPSFEGEPKKVSIQGDIYEFSEKLWDSLNIDNKVSLFVRYISLDGSGYSSIIINKNTKE
ncbi:MAG: inosine monophosphate cyclohydrolase [Clostridiales bacterium GWF2_38_85]|nr:MAG: inosine monophosphate cyclohydrolase [Clostridiales bacterium GWF2_38_85]